MAYKNIIKHYKIHSKHYDVLWLYSVAATLFISGFFLLCIESVQWIELAKIFATSFLLIGTFSLLMLITGRYQVAALILLAWLAFLPFIPWSRYAFLPAAIIGIILILKYAQKRINKHILMALPLLFISILGAGIYLDFHYHDWLAAGTIHRDTLFHASIAAMYKNYGIASMGINGLVPINYHTLSHKVMAGLSILSDMETLAVYGYLYFALAPLLLAFVIAGTACHFNSQLTFSKALLATSTLLLLIVFFPIFPYVAFWDSFYVSESYLVSLILLLASLTLLHNWATANTQNFINLILSFTFLIAAGLSKGSVGLVGLCVFGLLAITRYRTTIYWILLAIFSLLFYFLILKTAKSASDHMPIEPLSFIYHYVDHYGPRSITVEKTLLFLSVHFLPVWLCFIPGFYQSGKTYLHSFEFQVLFALLLPAAAISLTFNIGGGSAYYFSNIPSMIAIPFLIANHLATLEGTVKPRTICITVLILFCLSLFPGNFRDQLHINRSHQSPSESVTRNIQKLHAIRDNSPKNTIVDIINKDSMIKKIGCKSYYFFVAVAERPMLNNLPNPGLCPPSLEVYQDNIFMTKGFQLLTLELTP